MGARTRPTCACRPTSRACPPSPRPVTDIDGRARARAARRQRHDRPHLAGGLDQARRPGRHLPAGAGRRAARLQLLRLAARQPRGDDARHVREHPPAQPDRRRAPSAAGRWLHALLRGGADRRADVDLRRRDALHRRGRTDCVVLAGQGVRLGLLARLGRQGHDAARRARRDRRRASSASTARTWSAWACCRCSSPTARAPSRSG